MFDQQNVLASFALQLYANIKADPENDWASRMGEAKFGSRRDAPPLQAADLLAHCWYEVLTYGRDGIRPAVKGQINGALVAFEAAKNYELKYYSKATMDWLIGRAPLPTAKGKTIFV